MNIKDLAKKIEYFDNCYRKGEAKISDAEFDSLYNELKKRNPNHPIFGESMKLLSLDNSCFSEWWAESAKDEQMIVQPKFDGCALGLRYQSGTLVNAFSRSGRDVTEAARTVCNIPLELPEDGIAVSESSIEIRGELYAPTLSRAKSQALAANATFEHTSKIVLNAGDMLGFITGGAADVDVVVNYLEQTL